MPIDDKVRERVISLLYKSKTFRDMENQVGMTRTELKKSFRMPAFKLKFGVEIEGFSALTRRQIATIISQNSNENIEVAGWQYLSSSRPYWSITTDGSIRNMPDYVPEEKGYEIVSPPLYGRDGLKRLKRILKIIGNEEKMGGSMNVFRVNKSCSVHVHLDTSDLSTKDLQSIYRCYQYFEEDLDKMLPASRVQNTGREGRSFCESVKRLSFKDALSGDYGKYWSCKISNNIPTIEFRKHSASRKYYKLRNWILILNQIYQYGLENKELFLSDRYKELSLNLYDVLHCPLLMDYYNARKKKFSKKKKKSDAVFA